MVALPSQAGSGIWGEDSTAPVAPPRKPGRKPRVRAHPFAAAHEDLVAVLASAALKATASAATLTLPTKGDGPLASPELVRDQLDTAAGAVSSGLWQVPILEFDADLALAVLSEPDTDRAVWGTSLAHLSELSRFAADLLARGRLLPGVVVDWTARRVAARAHRSGRGLGPDPGAGGAAGSARGRPDDGLNRWVGPSTAWSTRRPGSPSAGPGWSPVVAGGPVTRLAGSRPPSTEFRP